VQSVSPALLTAKNLELAVPGTYAVNQEVVQIQGFAPSLDVISSKQRPRKITLYGVWPIRSSSVPQGTAGRVVSVGVVACRDGVACCSMSRRCPLFFPQLSPPCPLTLFYPLVAGSNGRQYRFLLKGHEDLRQDERVMQLFGLVNTLLSNNPETSKRDLLIGCVGPPAPAPPLRGGAAGLRPCRCACAYATLLCLPPAA
jgi:hypothetical protein